MKRSKEYFRGCLLGGAIGDAFGWPVEFSLDKEIKMKYGEKGVADLILGKNGKAEITDDTQMTLFTGEGLLVAAEGGISSDYISYVHEAYLAWLYTQGEYDENKDLLKFSLLNKKELFVNVLQELLVLNRLKVAK